MASEDQQATIEADAIRELNILVAKARAGDESVLPQMQRAMDLNPQIWRHFSGLADHVANEWIKLLAGSDLAVRESLSRKAEALRKELEGEDASAIDRLLVDAVITTWLESQYFSIVLAASGDKDHGTLRHVESLELRRDAAQKRHLAAIKSLAEVRKLLRRPPPPSPAFKADGRGSSRSKSRADPSGTTGEKPGPNTILLQHRGRG